MEKAQIKPAFYHLVLEGGGWGFLRVTCIIYQLIVWSTSMQELYSAFFHWVHVKLSI
jgi:hypothetical protein